MAAAVALDRDQVAGCIETTEVDQNHQSRPSLRPGGHALEVAMRNAVEEFGFTPRDEFDGVFNLPDTKLLHTKTVNGLEYSKLIALSETFSIDCELDDFSHRVVTVQPCKGSAFRDYWTVNFKSPRIAKAVVESMRLPGRDHLRDAYHLHNISDSSSMAGRIFEAIARRVLAGKDRMWSIPMVSDNKIPPTFSTSGTPPPATQNDSPMPATVVKTVDLLYELSVVTFDSNRYYIPASATNPFFDSFAITFNPKDSAAIISIIQITTSPKPGQADDGYLHICRLVARARELLDPPLSVKADIRVEFILVCPDDGLRYHWKMPNGWDENNTINNQIREGFSIRVPSRYYTTVRRVDLLLNLRPI